QRLLYVALTRAELVLRCSWARSRRFGERAVDRQPSPFLATIAACTAGLVDAEMPSPPPTGDPAAFFAEQRQRLHEQDSVRANDVERDRRSGGSPPPPETPEPPGPPADPASGPTLRAIEGSRGRP